MGSETGFEAFQGAVEGFGDGMIGVFPDDSAKFVIGMEGETMVYGPNSAAMVKETVPSLAISIVDKVVEQG